MSRPAPLREKAAKNITSTSRVDSVLYGPSYYGVPATNNFSAWNVVRWIFRPNYRAYVSPDDYRALPLWWGVRHPVALTVYRTRTVAFVAEGILLPQGRLR